MRSRLLIWTSLNTRFQRSASRISLVRRETRTTSISLQWVSISSQQRQWKRPSTMTRLTSVRRSFLKSSRQDRFQHISSTTSGKISEQSRHSMKRTSTSLQRSLHSTSTMRRCRSTHTAATFLQQRQTSAISRARLLPKDRLSRMHIS